MLRARTWQSLLVETAQQLTSKGKLGTHFAITRSARWSLSTDDLLKVFAASEAKLQSMLAVPRQNARAETRSASFRTDATRMKMMRTKKAPALTYITTFALLLSVCGSLLTQHTAAQSEKATAERTSVRYPTLSKYATDLTLLALQGKLPRTNERAADIDRVIAGLPSAQKTPVLVSESDLDRNIVARGVALKIASGDVPDELHTARVFSLRI